jgi:hypothetical protein
MTHSKITDEREGTKTHKERRGLLLLVEDAPARVELLVCVPLLLCHGRGRAGNQMLQPPPEFEFLMGALLCVVATSC